ncbi:MAG TPA: biotin/lipoyl-containing protein [Chryseolinea sp.]|nr:biotin/lipoyl-containing protein [Chryseolinea sp.]
MLFAKINGHRSLEIDVATSPFTIDGIEFPIDVAKLSDDKFHIVRNNKGYNAEIVDVNRLTKTVTVRINGSTHTVQLKDKFDLLLEKLGMNNAGGSRLNNLKAPMPGLIIDLRVSVGQSIQPGDPLLILEAMKMENIIKASGEGVVKRVTVKKGDSVEKGQVLIEF